MIIVTGATGTIGKSTVKALTKLGAGFKVAVRSPEKVSGVDAVRFDFDDPATYAPALAGAERLFLLTGLTADAPAQTARVAAAAKEAGVEHIVKLSVIGADSEPGTIFGRQHREGERAIEATGLAYTFLRPTFFMQNWLNYYGARLEQDSTVYLPHGQGMPVVWVDADDIGEVAAKALTTSDWRGKHFDLTGAEGLTDAQVAALVSELSGKTCTYVEVDEEAVRGAMAGAPDWMLEGFLELHRIIRAGYAMWPSPTLGELLGRAPTTFRQYLARTLAHG